MEQKGGYNVFVSLFRGSEKKKEKENDKTTNSRIGGTGFVSGVVGECLGTEIQRGDGRAE